MIKSELNKILVPVDFSETSETATSNAVIIAKLLNAEIFLLCVIEDNWRHFAKIMENQTEPATLIDIQKAIEKRMLDMQKKISLNLDIPPKIHIISGNVSKGSWAFFRNIDTKFR